MAAAGVAIGAGAVAGMLHQPVIANVFGRDGAVAGGVFTARRALTAIRDLLEAVSVVFLFAVAQWLEVRTAVVANEVMKL